MKIYYVITRVEDYIAYTTNPFLYRTYLNQLRKVSDNEIFMHGDVDSDESTFLMELNELLIEYGSKSPFRIDKSNSMFSIKDNNSDDIIVLTHSLYNSFVKEFIEYKEYTKILTSLYIHFGPQAGNLNGYINGDIGNFIIGITLKIFHEYYPNIKSFRDISDYDFYSDIQNRITSKFWEYYNEYYEVKIFFYTFLRTSDFKRIMRSSSISWS